MDKQQTNLLRTPTGRRLAGVVAALVILATAGCGVGQAVKDGTVDAAKWVFTTQVKTMSLDLVARPSINASDGGQPLSTVVRLYQLKDAKRFEQLDYTQLQTNDLNVLKADLLATQDVVLRPGASASVVEPMNPDAQTVGVVAFFRELGAGAVWKLAVPKKQWKKTDPVKIEVQDYTLVLVDAKDRPITRSAPQQSAPVSLAPKPKASTPKASTQPGTEHED